MTLADAFDAEVVLVDSGALDRGADHRGFDAGEALDSPHGVGDLVDDLLFDVVSGEVGVLQLGEVTVELGGIFAGDDGVLGHQAVFEGVFGGAGLALGCARAG